jgi:hypothetical protein
MSRSESGARSEEKTSVILGTASARDKPRAVHEPLVREDGAEADWYAPLVQS